MEKYIYILKLYSIHCKTQIFKNVSDKINDTKNTLFFLSQVPTNQIYF